MTSLLVAECHGDTLDEASIKALTAARAMEAPVHVLLAGAACEAAAQQAAKLEGVEKVLYAQDERYQPWRAEVICNLVMKLADNYAAIFSPSSTACKNFMPRVAALLDVAQMSDIIEVVSADTFRRPIYAGNAIETVQSSDSTKVCTVRTTAFAATPVGADSQAVVEKIDAAEDFEQCVYVGQELTKSDRPELSSAKIVISGGRGMQSGENFAMIEKVADKLGAAVGASRAAVDAGYVPNDYQVGQTGKIVAPDLYIAVGISGAIQHLAGMKDSKIIVAINKDEEAPIFQVADYGFVGDLFEALPELEKAL